LLAHSVALAHVSPLLSAHVSVTGLHSPLAQSDWVCASQLPSCKPSSGIGLPGPSLGSHVNCVPSQYSPASHSASLAHPPLGMHVAVPAEHTPDWHKVAALPDVQGP
jgi:hypothetical protein